MRNKLIVHISDIPEIGEFNVSYISINTHDSRQVVDKAAVVLYLEDVAYEIESQLRDALGIEGYVTFRNGVLRYGVYEIVGDLRRDLLKFNVTLYSYELEDGVISSSRETFI